MGQHNHHLLKDLCMLSNELKEVKLTSGTPELPENNLLDVPLNTFYWTHLPPKLEIQFASASRLRST